MGTGRGWGLDARFVLRSLWKSRGYVATAVLVLACAVAANASVLSYVRGTLLHEVSYPEPESVMLVWGSNVSDGQLRDVISGPSYIDLQERVTTLDPVAAFHTDGVYLIGDGRTDVLSAQEVTVDFLDVLGVELFMGRFFDDRDRMSGAAETVVVTFAFWRDRLGAAPDALGTVLPFVGRASSVIGVLPEDFEFIVPTPVFVPLRDDVLAARPRSNIHFNVIGRLAPSATVEDANRELRGVMDGIAAEHPGHEGWSFLVEPLHTVTVAAVRPVILVLVATVSLVLLVALVNLATLFRIRAFARGPELQLRSALGVATPFILAQVGELVPVWVAIPDSAARVPILTALLDPGVAAFAFVSAVIGSLVLTAPTFRMALSERVPSTARSVHPGLRGTRLLVGTEIAIATMLCIGAGLVLQSTGRLLSTDVGIEPEGLLTMYVGDVWDRDAPARTEYFREVVSEVERIPGVVRAGFMGYVDFQAEDDFAAVSFLDRALQPVNVMREEWRRVDEGLFETAGMRIVRGRGFESADFAGTPRSVVVNQAFAEKHYASGDAIGELLSLHNEAYRELRIVGIAKDVRSTGPAAGPPPMLYAPLQGDPRGSQGLHVRVQGDPMAYAAAVKDAVWAVDASQPIYDIGPMEEWVQMWIAIPRATRALVTSLATLAWLLSVLGVFGVVAYAVRTRRAEFGIRLALGASPGRLEADQLKAMAPVIGLGLSVGVVLGILGAKGAGAVLYGVSPLDPVALIGAITVMGGAAFVATFLPARRAGRVDPAEIIHAD